MRVEGWCEKCHTPQRVEVRDYAKFVGGGTIPIGTCQGCIDKVDKRRRDAGQLTIYVPSESSDPFHVIPGSAMVGRDTGEARITCYLEGDKYGSMKGDFDKMLLHAADRLVQEYPTIALVSLPHNELIEVGTYDYGEFRATITNQPMLDAWRARA